MYCASQKPPCVKMAFIFYCYSADDARNQVLDLVMRATKLMNRPHISVRISYVLVPRGERTPNAYIRDDEPEGPGFLGPTETSLPWRNCISIPGTLRKISLLVDLITKVRFPLV